MSRTAKTIFGILVIVAIWAMIGVGAAVVAVAMGGRPGGVENASWEGIAIGAFYLASCPLAIAHFIKRSSQKAAEEFTQNTEDRIGILKVQPQKPKQHGKKS